MNDAPNWDLPYIGQNVFHLDNITSEARGKAESKLQIHILAAVTVGWLDHDQDYLLGWER